MATVTTRREKNLCLRRRTKNALDSDWPSHGKRFRKFASFVRQIILPSVRDNSRPVFVYSYRGGMVLVVLVPLERTK